MIFAQPPLLSSAWQFEHHGAQRCTTVSSGVLIAPRTSCSAGDSARSEAVASASNIANRIIHMLYVKHKGETPDAQCRTQTQRLTSAYKTPTMASCFRDSSYAEIFPEEFRGYSA